MPDSRHVIARDESGALYAVPAGRAEEFARWLGFKRSLAVPGAPDEWYAEAEKGLEGVADFSGFEVELVPVCYEVRRVRVEELEG